VKRGKRTL